MKSFDCRQFQSVMLAIAVTFAPLLGQPEPVASRILQSEHLVYGFPGTHGKLLDRKVYAVSYNSAAKVPEWTAYKLRKRDLVDNVTRTDDFRPDLELDEAERAELKDYVGTSFDRGHMAPADDFTKSLGSMSMTFLLSNMAPQHGSLNRGMWRALEANTQAVAKKFDSCWVFTGTVFNRSMGKRRTLGELKNGSQKTIGKGKVWVPTHFFKVIFAHDRDGSPLVWAFLMSHYNTKLSGKVVDYAVSVDRIEQLTDLNFFSELSDDVENDMESKVNRVWPIK